MGELNCAGGRKLAVGCIYVNPEGVRSEESELLFEGLREDIGRYKQQGFEIMVMGDFNAHIGLGREQKPNRNGNRLLSVVGAENMLIGNKAEVCRGR